MPAIEHVLDFSDGPAYLHARLGQLLIERDGQEVVTVPLEEVAAVVVSHPAVRYAHSVLAGLAEHGGAFIVCDPRHLPAAILTPVQGHHTQAERFAVQAAARAPLKKRLWRQVVRAKILAQAELLEQVSGKPSGLKAMAARVRSGDAGNLEAQAARRYWPALMGKGFRRRFDAEDANRHLNYGYAIINATTARAIAASGLHPALGIHHHNRYNAFCLASDLTEPFRPLVDRAVREWVTARGHDAPLDREAKTHLLESITARYNFQWEERSLFDILRRTAASLAAVFDGRAKELLLPEPRQLMADQSSDEGEHAQGGER